MITNIKNFFNGSILLNIFTVFLGIATYRLLGPQEIGKLNIVVQIVTIISMVSSLSMPDLLARYLPNMNSKEQKNLFLNSLMIVTIFLGILLSLFIFLRKFFFIDIPKEVEAIEIFVYINIFIQIMFNLIMGYIRGVGNFKSFLKYESIVNIFSRLLGLVIFLFYFKSFESYYLAQLFVLAIVVSSFFTVSKGVFERSEFIITKKMSKYIAVLFLGNIIYIGANSFDVFLIRYYLDVQSVGLFTAAIMIPKTLQTIFLSKLQVPFLYYFSLDSKINKEDILEKATLFLGIVSALVSLTLMFLSNFIVSFLFGSNYNISSSVLTIFSLHFFLLCMLIFSGVYFNSIEKPFLGLNMSILGLIVNIILSFILVKPYGLEGVALSHIIGLIFQVIVYLYILTKFDIKINKLIILLFTTITIYVLSLFNSYLFFILFIVFPIVVVKFDMIESKFIRNILWKK